MLMKARNTRRFSRFRASNQIGIIYGQVVDEMPLMWHAGGPMGHGAVAFAGALKSRCFPGVGAIARCGILRLSTSGDGRWPDFCSREGRHERRTWVRRLRG